MTKEKSLWERLFSTSSCCGHRDKITATVSVREQPTGIENREYAAPPKVKKVVINSNFNLLMIDGEEQPGLDPASLASTALGLTREGEP